MYVCVYMCMTPTVNKIESVFLYKHTRLLTRRREFLGAHPLPVNGEIHPLALLLGLGERSGSGSGGGRGGGGGGGGEGGGGAVLGEFELCVVVVFGGIGFVGVGGGWRVRMHKQEGDYKTKKNTRERKTYYHQPLKRKRERHPRPSNQIILMTDLVHIDDERHAKERREESPISHPTNQPRNIASPTNLNDPPPQKTKTPNQKDPETHLVHVDDVVAVALPERLEGAPGVEPAGGAHVPGRDIRTCFYH